MLAFTGTAAIGTQRTIDGISAILRALPHESDFSKICETLKIKIRPLGKHGHLAVVASAASVGKPLRVAFISNFDWKTTPPSFTHDFRIEVRTISQPFWRISGLRSCVSSHELARLKALARRIKDAPQNEVLETLAKINESAAQNSGGWVSEECWVTAQSADDRQLHFATRNIGGQPGFIPQLQLGFDLAEFVRQNFQAAPGQELRLVQSAGRSGPGEPGPAPEGEPRNFIISGTARSGVLNSPSGKPAVAIENCSDGEHRFY